MWHQLLRRTLHRSEIAGTFKNHFSIAFNFYHLFSFIQTSSYNFKGFNQNLESFSIHGICA